MHVLEDAGVHICGHVTDVLGHPGISMPRHIARRDVAAQQRDLELDSQHDVQVVGHSSASTRISDGRTALMPR
jgi:hypothetical protein